MERGTAEEGPQEELALERIVFFSDAVIAIAITLLAIDIRLPELGHDETLPHALGALWPRYLSYAVSFLAIARTGWSITAPSARCAATTRG